MKISCSVEHYSGKIIKSCIEVHGTEEAYQDLIDLVSKNIDNLSFIDENGNQVVIKKEFLLGSVVTIYKCE